MSKNVKRQNTRKQCPTFLILLIPNVTRLLANIRLSYDHGGECAIETRKRSVVYCLNEEQQRHRNKNRHTSDSEEHSAL